MKSLSRKNFLHVDVPGCAVAEGVTLTSMTLLPSLGPNGIVMLSSCEVREYSDACAEHIHIKKKTSSVIFDSMIKTHALIL